MARCVAACLFGLLLVASFFAVAQAQESREARFQRLLSGFKHIELKGRLYPPDGFDVKADSLQGETVDSTLAEEFLCPALNYGCRYSHNYALGVSFTPLYRVQLSKDLVGLAYIVYVYQQLPVDRIFLSTFKFNEAQRIETVALEHFIPSGFSLGCDLNADRALACRRIWFDRKPNDTCDIWETESNYKLNSDGYFMLESERQRVHEGVALQESLTNLRPYYRFGGKSRVQPFCISPADSSDFR